MRPFPAHLSKFLLEKKSPESKGFFGSSKGAARDSASAAEVVACGVLGDRGIVSRFGRAARVGDTRDKVRVSRPRPGIRDGSALFRPREA